ncbi:hypothetical protein B9Z55_011063 [Caenorhabditis nigoni]|uniref:F-box domain-containing protein n=1 Tax=Caenorhabditis nigoni TaxID=1611254 RepID=A0A2G5UIH0_9PELO|nr:hypothetical protein B9Z55_011063 [Caenorhabditis nigoni]
MSEQRFPFRRLPDDICLKVLKTTDYCEMAGYSLVSKKAHSMVKSLRVPITRGKILVASSMEIRLITNDLREIDFNFKVPENDGEMTSLNDLPVRVDVSMKKNLTDWRGDKHLYVINQSFDEPSEKDIMYAENVLRVFLPLVETVQLNCVTLRKHFFVQHIGMANLKRLDLKSDHNVKFDDLLTLNVEKLIINKAKNISLRDLNRFFKLWMKGSFPKLKFLYVKEKTRTIPDWNVLLKGLKAKEEEKEMEELEEDEEEEEEEPYVDTERKFKIKNCRGVWAELTIDHYLNHKCLVSLYIFNS